MTIDEKRREIEAKCNSYDDCTDKCPLRKYTGGVGCYLKNTCSDEQVERNYEIMFGTDEEPTTQLETIVDDADTVIKIKSSRKIDNITIYFKEE